MINEPGKIIIEVNTDGYKFVDYKERRCLTEETATMYHLIEECNAWCRTHWRVMRGDNPLASWGKQHQTAWGTYPNGFKLSYYFKHCDAMAAMFKLKFGL